MTVIAAPKVSDVTCPGCGADVLYKYGKDKRGKQRFYCLICERQFVPGISRPKVDNRPICPLCGEDMNLYMRGDGVLRFRCSAYPECRTYKKVSNEEE